MRSHFENHLKKINQEINDKTGENPEELSCFINENYKGNNGQKTIAELQAKKAEVMARLKRGIAGLESGETKEKDNQEKKIIYQEGKFYLDEPGMDAAEVSLGEILTDGEWGINYYLDPDSVPRNTRKKYLVERAKGELCSHLNKQIIIDEIEFEGSNDWKKKLTYKKILDDKESGRDFEVGGLIAEKMVQNFLKKISYDHDVQFEIIRADVYQDVEQKVDFIIRRKSRLKGVGVEEIEKGDNIGVQFTTNIDPEVLRYKRKQIKWAESHLKDEDNLEGLVLVRIPIENTRGLYEKWKKDKKPGGPDKLWDAGLKERIFKQTLQGILTDDEIKLNWEKVK